MHWLNSSPCKGIDCALTENDSAKLAEIIAKKEGVLKAEIHQSFKYEGWLILYVSGFNSEDPYLFYSEDPERLKHPITKWSGAATMLETTEIKEWILQNAPGIPESLASCFA